MDLGLKGKKVIINGGSRGIGKAALEIYAAEGCDIAFFSRDAARVAATVAEPRAVLKPRTHTLRVTGPWRTSIWSPKRTSREALAAAPLTCTRSSPSASLARLRVL